MPREGYGRAASSAAGILFTNPAVALALIVGTFIAFIVIGGLALPTIISMFFNIWMWVAALAISLLFKPRSGIVLIFAVLMSLGFWGFSLYQEYLAMQQICSIPIIGWIACAGWNVITFIPKLMMLGITFSVSFAMLWTISFLRYQLVEKK